MLSEQNKYFKFTSRNVYKQAVKTLGLKFTSITNSLKLSPEIALLS